MKNSFLSLLIIALIGVQFGCGGEGSGSKKAATDGTVISGQLTGAENLKAYLDLESFAATRVIGKSEIDANGNYEIIVDKGLKPGRYRFRVGARRLGLVFDGTETNVKISGKLADLDKYKLPIEGSEASQELAAVMDGMYNNTLNTSQLMEKTKNASNPFVALTLALTNFRTASEESVALHKSIYDKLKAKDYKESELSAYGGFIGQIEKQIALQRIAVGKSAPDINLPSPSGKNYALSDYKGKVVLLDFWASWCGPCRRENPNVVEVYNRYKNKGFEVFSVSLDGLDDRTKRRFATQEQIDEQMERSKDRWKAAIQQDGLVWEGHVSDLKKWSSAPAQTYGVSGIPRTFMIDREGKIAAIGLRGAEAIETELLKLL
ncbi:MAG: TlpA disulfide reductase family protein [Bacteroidota bacterium]